MKKFNRVLLAFFSLLFCDNFANAQANVVTTDSGAVVSDLSTDSASLPKVNLFPNAATDMLHIKTLNCSRANVEVTNADGKVLQSFIMKASETSISTENFASGVYIVKIKTAKATAEQRFSKH
ncbi:MAG: T9SS type A sorting domain-containing protein [Bacteroidia bacterium]